LQSSGVPIVEYEDAAVKSFLQQQRQYHDSISAAQNQKQNYPYNADKQKNGARTKPLTPFSFDPNAMTFPDWKKLGFTDKEAQQIQNYQAKGGYFKEKIDLKKLYCVTEEDYKLLEPYIHITLQQKEGIPKEAKPILNVKQELNATDSIQLQKIPGIGIKTASRIIQYREKLGGYVHIDQLKEVYGIDSARFLQIATYLLVNPNHIRKININTASIKELVQHPYIDYSLAKSIVVHRQNKGNYRQVEDIKQAVHFYDELYSKIAIYLCTE
jgi:competence ComEA-like helix-hairpin-helix protein